MQVKDRAATFVQLQHRFNVRQIGPGELAHRLEIGFGVHQDTLNICRCQVTQHAKWQGQVLMHQCFYISQPAPFLNDGP